MSKGWKYCPYIANVIRRSNGVSRSVYIDDDSDDDSYWEDDVGIESEINEDTENRVVTIEDERAVFGKCMGDRCMAYISESGQCRLMEFRK